jgi:formate transporter
VLSSEEPSGTGAHSGGRSDLPHSEFDALLPPEMARKAEQLGADKARMAPTRLFALAILGGAFIALGAMFATTVMASPGLPFGVVRMLGGLVFSLGLILVVIGGAELFTGNSLMVMAWAARKVTGAEIARAWTIVYAGNLVGAVATAALVFLSGQFLAGRGVVAELALRIAADKAALPFERAVPLGVLCNVLVCLAIWLCYSARSTTDKVLVILFPVSAFVAAGFEHSVANMYFIPLGLFIKAWGPTELLAEIGRDHIDLGALSIAGFIHNLVPVTLGNIIGGAGLVGCVYWFIYLRDRQAS